jgi:nucleotidyltransferase/DNA polymerase involved in DNA repair
MRIIGHLDMDSFFASIEERDNIRFRGRPIVVGADPEEGRGRGVVSTANYAARAYGIRSALPIQTAYRLSEEARRRGLPPAVFLGVNMEKYGDFICYNRYRFTFTKETNNERTAVRHQVQN